MYNFTKFYIRKTAVELFRQDKRFAGHSKWQNIRHIKQEKDAERSAIFKSLATRMKIAIAGKDFNFN